MLDPTFIRSVLENGIQDNIINGASVLVGTPVETLLDMSVGCATDAKDIPMTADTVIDGASTTKVVVGITALLILKDRGLIDLDRPFTDYLPQYTAPLSEPISIRELANHVSGYAIGSPAYGKELTDHYTGTSLLRTFLSTPPQSPKTPHAHYSCWNYHLLGQLIQNVSGKSLDDFAMEEIFTPLHMDSSSLGTPRPTIPAERIAQTITTPRPGMISDAPAALLQKDGILTANAGLFTTARDYRKLLNCYLANGTPILSPGAVAECLPDTMDQTDGYRRFGWCIWDSHLCQKAFGSLLLHSGWSGQTICADFKRNMTIIVLTTRCGDYERAKSDRFAIINHVVTAS